MNHKELRIGNYIDIDIDGKKHYKVDSIISLDQYPWFELYVDDIDYDYALHIKPIALTEEWLIKFGFKKNTDDYILYIKSYCDITYSGDKIYLTFGQFAEMSETVPCEYVHQLQNLYYALTNEELNIEA